MSSGAAKPRRRRTAAIVSLSAITAAKLLLLFICLGAGWFEPIIGGNAVGFYLPAADSLFTRGTYNDPATSFYSGQAPG